MELYPQYLFTASYILYSPAWDLDTIPQTQAIKETPRTRKNIAFMRVFSVF